MSTPVITILPNKTVQDAAELMTEKDVSCLIVAWGEEAVGVLVDKDIIRRVVSKGLPYSTKVRDVMSKPIISIKPDASIRRAAFLMRENKISRLPIIEKGKIIGIIPESDFVKLHEKSTILEVIVSTLFSN